MECKNCGWENEPNALRCIKCNAPLQGSMIGNVLKDTLNEPSVAEV